MKKFLCVFLALAMAVALAACGDSSDSDMTEERIEDIPIDEIPLAAPIDDSQITVGFAQVGHESDWRMANTADYRAVFSKENGYNLLFVDCNNNNTVQLDVVRTFIQQGIDYIVLTPVQSTGWEDVLQEAKEAGIPVIVVDRQVDADASMYDAFIGTDTHLEGIAAGNWLAEYLNGEEARILEIYGTVEDSAAIGRAEGFRKVAAGHPEWTILDSQSGDQKVMESFIKNYKGKFNVVYCHNDDEVFGVMDAMDAAGITYGIDGDVIIISFDATHDGLQYTLDGKIHCNVERNPLQAAHVAEIIRQMEAGEEFATYTLVEDAAFVAPGITSQYAVTMTQEILDGRAY